MSAAAHRAVSTGETWMLLLPPGWVSLPTDPDKAKAAVRKVTDRMLESRARDQLVRARIEVERSLLSLVEQARTQGAATVHVLVEPISGVPVSASLTVTELSVTEDRELVAAVQQVFGAAEGVQENGWTSVAGLPALRRRRRYQRSFDEEAGLPAVWHTNLDYVVETGPGELLTMVFATATDELADVLVSLFDAIAGSLHRRSA